MLTTAAVAQNRPSTTAMTCRQAASLVYARGAIVLGTGGYTYDRFVRDRSFCQITEALESLPRLWRAPGCQHGIRRPALSDTAAMNRAGMTCSRNGRGSLQKSGPDARPYRQGIPYGDAGMLRL